MMDKSDIILKLYNAQETLDGLKADNDYDHTTGDPRFDEVLKMIGECIDALRKAKDD